MSTLAIVGIVVVVVVLAIAALVIFIVLHPAREYVGDGKFE